MHAISIIFDMLEDGRWHSLTEIAGRSGLHKFKLEIAINFLAEYDFIKLDKTNQKVKLTTPVADFLKKIKFIEKGEGRKTIKLQEES